MENDFLHTGGQGGVGHGEEVVDVAVHAAVGEAAEQVHGFRGALPGGSEGRVLRERAVFDGHIDAGDVLRHYAASADIQMPHFGVAELAGGQADHAFGGVDRAVGVLGFEAVEIGGVGEEDGVVVAFGAVAEAVENEEDDGFGELAHDMRRAGNWDGALYSGLGGN